MPTFASSQEWLEQSSLLLQARPATARITTKYSIKRVKLREKKKTEMEAAGQDTTPKPPRGSLVLKTYDPVSGVTLKYRTTKAAEVSRLVHSLGRLGRTMAALPPEQQDEAMPDVADPAESKVAAGTAKAGSAEGKAGSASSAQQPSQQQTGGKKKKKGKK